MPRKKGLEEAEIQKLHTTAPEHLTDDELLLSTFCAEDLARKHSGGWDNDHPKCRFCGKGYRFRTFATQCHMTSQIKGSGKQSRVTEVCSMESKTDDALKARFLAVRKEITIATPRSSRPNSRHPVRYSNEVCKIVTGKVKLSR